ncbi:hypothetical protein MKX01_016765 [Papaver californicum]|nr:hypothetical protein MKX01_016765 [Papaver californicum]
MCDKLIEQIEELMTRFKKSIHLKDCKAQYSEMYEELKRYKMTCDQLNEQNEEFKRRGKELVTQEESRLEKQLNEHNEEFERRCKELATQAESRLEIQLNDYKANNGEMYVRFKEGKKRMAALESDLKEYMRICGELNEQKKKVKDENEVLKTNFRELESKAAFYLQELDDYKVKCHGLSVELNEKELEFVEYQSKLKSLGLTTNAFVGELEVEGYKMAMKGLKEQITGLAEDRKVFCEREKKEEERIVYLQEVIKCLVEEQFISPYSPFSTTKQSEPLVNLNGDKGNAGSLFNMKFIVVFKQDNLKPLVIIQMCSNENDKEIRPRHTCDTGSKQRLNVSTSNRPFFDQKGQEYGISCEAVDITLSSEQKRDASRHSNYDCDDFYNINNSGEMLLSLRMKKPKECTVSPTPKISPMNICAGNIALSSKCQIAEDCVANLRRRPASQKMCRKEKPGRCTLPVCLEMGGRSSQDKVGSLTTENDGNKVTEETDSDGGGDSNTEDAVDNEYLNFPVRRHSRF